MYDRNIRGNPKPALESVALSSQLFTSRTELRKQFSGDEETPLMLDNPEGLSGGGLECSWSFS